MRAFIVLSTLLLCFTSWTAAADEPVLWRDTLTPRAQTLFDKQFSGELDYIMEVSRTLHWGYVRPKTMPKVYLVSRAYIIAHERTICFDTPEAMLRECSENIFGWIDDARDIYILRGEDVAKTKALSGVRDFPVDLWIEMEMTHELMHDVQMETSPYRPTTLPCALEAKWETEAHNVMHWWLNSLERVDAGRINTLFRGFTPFIACGGK